MTLQGDGITVASTGDAIAAESVSKRLTSYPAALLTKPFTQNAATFTAHPGGPAHPPVAIADAAPVDDVIPTPSVTAQAAVPGGVASEIPSVFRVTDLSPAVVLVAIATAVVLGAGHAVTPGHGKTLMAAYLVGTRGTRVHAAGLGLSVTISHTIGILALAVLVVAAQSALPPDAVARWLPAIAALAIVGVGGWMITSELRGRRCRARHDADHAHDHEPRLTAITWRSLFVLGLAGGITPSTSALLILLGSIAAGRAVFGVVLVVAFGLGMALVMTAVGLAMVHARNRLDRLPTSGPLRRLPELAPLAAGIVILILGVWLTAQSITGQPAF
jgi:nickel/cobalt transporter (NicO) family protein